MPTSITPADMLAGYHLQYDGDNRLTDFASYSEGFSTSYGYDTRDQLTSATSSAIAGLSAPFLPAVEAYDFDSGGNRRDGSGGSQSASGSYNQIQSDGTYDYVYDDEGNLTGKTHLSSGAVTEYTWDHRNRLTSVTDRPSAGGAMTQHVELTYDALDQLVGKQVDADGDGTLDRSEVYAWADGQEVLRFVDSDGVGVTQPHRLANRYLWGAAVDELLADEQYAAGAGPAVDSSVGTTQVGETLWALTDHLGSVRDLVDNGGTLRQHVVYDSFGNRVSEQDYNSSGLAISSTDPAAIDSLFGYTGRLFDEDIQLQSNRARWYDPQQGRWISQDPIGFAAGDANLYRYVGNGPVDATDPSGLVVDPRKMRPWPKGKPLNSGKTQIYIRGQGDSHVVEQNDLRQGNAPNCWLIAGIGAIAKVSPSKIQSLITRQNGQIFVGVYAENQLNQVEVFPNYPVVAQYTGDTDSAGNEEIWPILLEMGINRYAYQRGFRPWGWRVYKDPFYPWTGRSSQKLSGNEFYPAHIYRARLNSQAIIAATPYRGDNSEYNLHGNHAYMVNGCSLQMGVGSVVKLRNPWGHSHPKPIPISEFRKLFANVWISAPLSGDYPDGYLHSSQEFQEILREHYGY